jgi:hypothetical protein
MLTTSFGNGDGTRTYHHPNQTLPDRLQKLHRHRRRMRQNSSSRSCYCSAERRHLMTRAFWGHSHERTSTHALQMLVGGEGTAISSSSTRGQTRHMDETTNVQPIATTRTRAKTGVPRRMSKKPTISTRNSPNARTGGRGCCCIGTRGRQIGSREMPAS